jgi:hypothetical protein
LAKLTNDWDKWKPWWICGEGCIWTIGLVMTNVKCFYIQAPPHQIGKFGLGWTTGPAAARHVPCHHTSAPAPAAKAMSRVSQSEH